MRGRKTVRPHLVAIMGPTASGKTELAEALADRLDAALINADAFQVYLGMDIGTGKSVHKERYSLIDLHDPREQFGLGKWIEVAMARLTELWEQGRSGILVGGTGLYVRALMEGYSTMGERPVAELRASLLRQEAELGSDTLLLRLRNLDPATAARVDAANPLRVRRALERALSPRVRPPVDLPGFEKVKMALCPPRAQLVLRIERRVDRMLGEGWLAEVERLQSEGVGPDAPGMKAIGYRELSQVVQGNLSLDEAVARIKIATRQYAKRQRTWLRKEPGLKWLSWSDGPGEMLREAVETVEHP